MKRRLFGLLVVLMLLLSACGTQPEPSAATVEYDGKSFQVDTEKGTVTCGEDVYQVSVSAGGSSRTTTITYPNGGTYYWTDTGNGGHGGWDEGYDPQRYVSGDVLLRVLEQVSPAARERKGNPVAGILCILLGAVNLAFPQLVWYLKHGWVYKDAEPSQAAIGFTRVAGAVVVIAGIVLAVI